MDLNQIKKEVGPGWGDILERLVEDLKQLGWNEEVLQVKEKFGHLRFYIGEGTDLMFQRIRQAEEESATTCEECGMTGHLLTLRNWLFTLCDNCAQKRKAG